MLSTRRPSIVKQRDSFGCAIACAAMVAGRSYADVCSDLKEAGARFEEIPYRGLDMDQLEELLGRYGFAVRRQYYRNPITSEPRASWPPEPFAPVHVCHVGNYHSGHYVVLLSDGRVLDPGRDYPSTLADYERVTCIYGLFQA